MFHEASAGFGESGELSLEKALVDLGLFSFQDKDKVSLTKTPKLDRSDGGKEVKERATKRKLPFTVGTNGDQKDSDTGTGMPHSTLKPWLLGLVGSTQGPVCSQSIWKCCIKVPVVFN